MLADGEDAGPSIQRAKSRGSCVHPTLSVHTVAPPLIKVPGTS